MTKKTGLTELQREDLTRLSEYFEKLEKLAARNNIDLDVFISEYKDDGYAIYSTEKIELQKKAQRRKKVFEKTGREKTTRKA